MKRFFIQEKIGKNLVLGEEEGEEEIFFGGFFGGLETLGTNQALNEGMNE